MCIGRLAQAQQAAGTLGKIKKTGVVTPACATPRCPFYLDDKQQYIGTRRPYAGRRRLAPRARQPGLKVAMNPVTQPDC
jgi:hypothetical protein